MRLHLKNLPPEVHGMITEHKAYHNHANLDDTVSCLIKTAMDKIDIVDKTEDMQKLIKFQMAEIDKMTAEYEILKDKYERFIEIHNSIEKEMVANE